MCRDIWNKFQNKHGCTKESSLNRVQQQIATATATPVAIATATVSIRFHSILNSFSGWVLFTSVEQRLETSWKFWEFNISDNFNSRGNFMRMQILDGIGALHTWISHKSHCFWCYRTPSFTLYTRFDCEVNVSWNLYLYMNSNNTK